MHTHFTQHTSNILYICSLCVEFMLKVLFVQTENKFPPLRTIKSESESECPPLFIGHWPCCGCGCDATKQLCGYSIYTPSLNTDTLPGQ